MFQKNRLTIVGDLLAILVLTLIGFASHNELTLSFIPRMGITFFSMAISWFVIAPWFGLFEGERSSRLGLYWRIVIAALYASTMAASLRGLLLGTAILPIFIAVLAGTTALGMVLWRWVLSRFIQKR